MNVINNNLNIGTEFCVPLEEIMHVKRDRSSLVFTFYKDKDKASVQVMAKDHINDIFTAFNDRAKKVKSTIKTNVKD